MIARVSRGGHALSLRKAGVATSAAGETGWHCKSHVYAGWNRFRGDTAPSGDAGPQGSGLVARVLREVFDHLFHRVRDGAGRLRFPVRSAASPGRTDRSSAHYSSARPGAAEAATGARLRVQGSQRQDHGPGRFFSPEARLRAAMLPACGEDRARASACVAGIE